MKRKLPRRRTRPSKTGVSIYFFATEHFVAQLKNIMSKQATLPAHNNSHTTNNSNDMDGELGANDDSSELLSEYGLKSVKAATRKEVIKKYGIRITVASFFTCCAFIFILILFVIIFAILLGTGALNNFCSVEWQMNGGNQVYIFNAFKEACQKAPYSTIIYFLHHIDLTMLNQTQMLIQCTHTSAMMKYVDDIELHFLKQKTDTVSVLVWPTSICFSIFL